MHALIKLQTVNMEVSNKWCGYRSVRNSTPVTEQAVSTTAEIDKEAEVAHDLNVAVVICTSIAAIAIIVRIMNTL